MKEQEGDVFPKEGAVAGVERQVKGQQEWIGRKQAMIVSLESTSGGADKHLPTSCALSRQFVYFPDILYPLHTFCTLLGMFCAFQTFCALSGHSAHFSGILRRPITLSLSNLNN